MFSLSVRRVAVPAANSRLLTRSYSAAAAAEFQPDAAAGPEFTSIDLFNGVKIGTFQNCGALASVAMYIKGGSRYESHNNRGSAHCLKNLAFQNTNNQYSVGIMRAAEHHGIRLSSAATREHIVVKADCTTGNIDQVVDIMLEEITSPKFQLHEVSAAQEYSLHQSHASLSDPIVFLTEQLHKNAFVSGIGNSVYATPNQLSKMTPESLKDYLTQHINSGSVTFVGSGVYNHQLRDALVENSNIEKIVKGSAPKAESSTYFGGKSVFDSLDGKSRIMVAVQGGSLFNEKSLAEAVFAALLGGKSSLKYGSGLSRLSKITKSGANASAFNFSYSDAGLVGFYLETSNGQINDAYKASLAEINEIANSITNEELARAQNTLKHSLSSKQGSVLSMVDEVANKLDNSSYLLPHEVGSAISKVTVADLKLIAKRFTDGEKTIVVAADDFKGY